MFVLKASKVRQLLIRLVVQATLQPQHRIIQCRRCRLHTIHTCRMVRSRLDLAMLHIQQDSLNSLQATAHNHRLGIRVIRLNLQQAILRIRDISSTLRSLDTLNNLGMRRSLDILSSLGIHPGRIVTSCVAAQREMQMYVARIWFLCLYFAHVVRQISRIRRHGSGMMNQHKITWESLDVFVDDL